MVSHARDVHHPESVPQGLLLEVAEPWVGDVLEAAVAKEFEQWLVVHCDDEVAAPEDKVTGLIKGVCHSEGFPLHWGVS